MTSLKQWLISATSEEITRLAKTAGTSRAYLYQLAVGHRKASAMSAGQVVDAANLIGTECSRLPVLRRSELCDACRMCPHAKNDQA